MSDETTIADPPWVHALMWLGFPTVGAGVAWLLQQIADWVAGLAWAPWQGPFKLVADVPEPQAAVGALVVGGVAGLVLAGVGEAEAVKIKVDDERVTVTKQGKHRTATKEQITAAFLDGKHLVLLGHDGQELVRDKPELDRRQVTDAFKRHGYPWRDDGDPHRGEYRRWVESDPDLPRAADAFLRARAKALKAAKPDDADELREELAKLGVVVRDEKKKQYWRAVR